MDYLGPLCMVPTHSCGGAACRIQRQSPNKFLQTMPTVLGAWFSAQHTPSTNSTKTATLVTQTSLENKCSDLAIVFVHREK